MNIQKATCKTLILPLLLSLVFSTVAGKHIVNMASANPYGAEMEYNAPPIITVNAPINNETIYSDSALLNFTVAKPEGWLIHGGFNAKQMLRLVSYELDGKNSDTIIVNDDLVSPLDYSINLTNLDEGIHILKVNAYATGWLIEMHGLWENEIPINSSSITLYFRIDTASPTITILPIQNSSSSNILLNFTISKPTTRIAYSLDNRENITTSGNTTLSGLTNGLHNVTVYVWGIAGKAGASETAFFSVHVPQPKTADLASVVSGITAAALSVGVIFYVLRRNSNGWR